MHGIANPLQVDIQLDLPDFLAQDSAKTRNWIASLEILSKLDTLELRDRQNEPSAG